MLERPNPTPPRAAGWGLLGLWIALLAALRASSDKEVDAFWMAREGLALLQGQPLVHPDTWSWAPVDRDFVPTSPLWELLLGASWHWLGVPGVFLLSWLSIGMALVVTAVMSRRFGASAELTVGILIVAIVLGAPLFVARAALPALTLFTLLLLFGTTNAPRLRTLRPVQAYSIVALLFAGTVGFGLWLHASWSAYGLAALVVLSALIASDRGFSLRRRCLLVATGTAGTLFGIAVGPRGFQVFADAARVAEECRNLVIEWMPPWQVGMFWAIAWATSGVALTATAVRQYRAGTHWSAPEQLLVLLAIGAWAVGAQATRFLVAAWYLSLPSVAIALAGVVDARVASKWVRVRMQSTYWRPVLGMLLPVLIPVLIVQTSSAYSPIMDKALQALPSSCRLFAKDDLSSPVLLVRPDVKVWIDGRLDYWGRERMVQTDRYLQSRQQRIAPPGTTCMLVRSDVRPPVYPRLESSWKRLAVGTTVEVWVPQNPSDPGNANA